MLLRRYYWLALGIVPWWFTVSPVAAELPPTQVFNSATPQSDANALQSRLWADLADERLDDFTLVEAALIAGGIADRDILAHHNRQLSAWLAELREAKEAASPKERARAVLEFMHRRVLSAGFHQDGTNLAGALDEGRFNCVSSTILFLTLARGVGLEVEAVAEPAHVFCRLLLEQGALDVQTTDPNAFSPDRQTLEPSVASPRAISEKGILAIVYYNAGVERLARREFSQALEANGRAVQLDPAHREARANLLATYNNWAVECVRQGNFHQAIRLIQAARQVSPGHANLTANLRSVYQQWAADHLQAGRFKESLAVLDESLEALPHDEILGEARHAVERRWMKARKAAE